MRITSDYLKKHLNKRESLYGGNKRAEWKILPKKIKGDEKNASNTKNNVKKPSNTKNNVKKPSESSAVKSSLPSAPSLGGTRGVDLRPIYEAWQQSADAQRQTVESMTGQKRQDLTTQIERLRETAEQAEERRRRDFGMSRADLEERAFMSNRANQASASARGLSGSGLQQLSQLRNMMQQNQDVNQLASGHAEGQEEIREGLMAGEEDYTTALSNIEEVKSNTLREIESTLATQKAQAKTNEDIRRAEAAARAAASNAQMQYQKELQEAALNQEKTLAQRQIGSEMSGVINSLIGNPNMGKEQKTALIAQAKQNVGDWYRQTPYIEERDYNNALKGLEEIEKVTNSRNPNTKDYLTRISAGLSGAGLGTAGGLALGGPLGGVIGGLGGFVGGYKGQTAYEGYQKPSTRDLVLQNPELRKYSQWLN